MFFAKAKSDADFALFSVAENTSPKSVMLENATFSDAKSASDFAWRSIF